MPYIDFNTVRPLSPSACKLYLYFLHHQEQCATPTLTLSLAQLGAASGLQRHAPWKAPSQYHGHDGRLRTALDELIDHGFLQKEAGRGRQPNTYSLLKTTTPSKGKERNTPMSP